MSPQIQQARAAKQKARLEAKKKKQQQDQIEKIYAPNSNNNNYSEQSPAGLFLSSFPLLLFFSLFISRFSLPFC
jgi:hypothetical protein